MAIRYLPHLFSILSLSYIWISLSLKETLILHTSQVTAISHGPTLLHSLLVVRGQLSVIQRIMRRHVKFALLTLLLFCSILVDSKMNEETNKTEIVQMGGVNKLPLATDTGALPFKLSNH